MYEIITLLTFLVEVINMKVGDDEVSILMPTVFVPF